MAIDLVTLSIVISRRAHPEHGLKRITPIIRRRKMPKK